MYKQAVKYRDTWLAPASKGLEMFQEKKFKELDAHLKELDRKERQLVGNKTLDNNS